MRNYERVLAMLKEVEPYVCHVHVGLGEYGQRIGKQVRVDLQFETVELAAYWKKEIEDSGWGWKVSYSYVMYADAPNCFLLIYATLGLEEYEEAREREDKEWMALTNKSLGL